MKNLIILILVSFSFVLNAQLRPDQFSIDTSPAATDAFYTQEAVGGIPTPRKIWLIDLKKYYSPLYNSTPINYTPTPTGNGADLGTFVETFSRDVYYIDNYGNSVLLYDRIFQSGNNLILTDDTLVIPLPDSTVFSTLYALADTAADIRADFPVVDSTRLIQDSILVYYQSGAEVGRDTITGTGGGGGDVALENYDSLMAYTGGANTIFINDTRVHGFFNRVTTGTHNRITLVEATNGIKWAREFDGYNYHDAWVEVDSVKWAASTTGVARTEWNAVLKTFQLAPAGSVVVLSGNTDYYADEVIGFDNENIQASGVSIHVANQTTTNPTGAFSGVTSFTVDDATGFFPGQHIGIANGGGTSSADLIAFASLANRVKIASVTGNTIVVESAVGAIDATDVIFSSSDIFSVQGAQTGTFIGIKFDGNRANNSANNGWETASIISSNTKVYIERCSFTNIVNVPVFCASGYVGNNYCDSIGGAALVHISQGTISVLDDRRTLTVENNSAYNMGLTVTDATHQNNFVEFSSSVYNLTVKNNYVRNSNGGFIGPHSVDDWHLNIKDNECYNMCKITKNAVEVNSLTLDNYQSDIVIEGNKFIDAGNIYLSGGTPASNLGLYRAKFNGNTVKNGIVFTQGLYGSEIKNNLIFMDSNFVYADRIITGQTNNLDNALVVIRTSFELEVSGNEIFSTEEKDSVYVGIQTLGCDNSRFTNNKIKGFLHGLSFYNNTAEGLTPHLLIAQNNQIEARDYATAIGETYGACIVFAKGNIIDNNILTTETNSGFAVPLLMKINTNSNTGITTLSNNLLYSELSTALYYGVSLNDDDEMLIVNNSGTCSTPANFIHPDFLGGVNTLIVNNNALDSDLVTNPVITFPLYLNFLNE
jgi:hypothetical protein